MGKLKFISLNTNGLNNLIKRKRVIQKLKKEGGEIIFLQETHLSKVEHVKLEKLASSQVFSSSFTSARRGVAVLIKNNLMFKSEKCIRDKEGRYVLVIGEIEGQYITLINVYNPPGQGADLMKKILTLLMTEGKGMIIMGGDLNLIMNQKDTQSKIKHKAEQAAVLMRKAQIELGLVDVWRCLHPQEKAFTFFSGAHDVYSRLDYFFIFKNDISKVIKCEILPIAITDHAPVIMELNLKREQGETSWRLNNSLLEDQRFKAKIEQSVKSYLEINDNEEVTSIILWEAAKATIRGEIIAYSSQKKREREREKNTLENKIKGLQEQHERHLDKEIQKQLKEAKKALDIIETQEIEKDLMLCRQTYYDNSPKALKILAAKLKKQKEKSTITIIKDGNDVLQRGKTNIAACFRDYYQNLYTPETVDVSMHKIKEYLTPLNLPIVTDKQNNDLVKPITQAEITTVIQKSKTGKSPGSDGFTNEFFKCFSSVLLPILCRVFNDILQTGKWPDTWNSAIITVIPKEGKDLTNCSSYRPISLLNVDQKIFTSIIANRLSYILPDIINLDQTGFVKDRLLSDNVRRTLNIIDQTVIMKQQMLTLTLDAEKAFDRVSWPFVFGVCEKFGFHKTFIKLMEGMYKKPNARVRVNGMLSKTFMLKRGVKQGDPISPQIFNLCIEPLAEHIRENNKIKGVTLKSEEHKLAMYADDIIVYLTDIYKSLPGLLDEIRKYGSMSGYKLNLNKTEAMLVGGNLEPDFKKQFNIKWDQNKVKYLGVIIPNNLKELYHCNYEPLENAVKQDFSRWKIIPSSLLERIKIIKMNVLPRFLFLFQNLPLYIPPTSFHVWEGMFRTFIWDAKKPRVKLKTLQQNKDRGGLALPNLTYYYYAAQIKPILIWMNIKKSPKWKTMECKLVESLGTLIFTAYNKAQIKYFSFSIFNTFKIWKTICKIGKVKEQEIACMREMSRDFDFTPNSTDNVFKIWEGKGLTRFYQMYNEEGMVSFEHIVDQYSLSRNQFYRYLQVRSYLKDGLKIRNLGNLHPLLKYIIKSHERNDYKNTIGQLYQIFQENSSEDLDYIKDKWDKELRTTIQGNEWNRSFKDIFNYIRSPFWQEYAWKINIRYFQTPLSISKYTSDSSCWRECGEKEADHTHIFLTCPKIQSFWTQILKIIEQIFKRNVNLENYNILLGIRPRDMQSRDLYLLWILRITALKQITRCWKSSEQPRVDIWLEQIENMYLMEKLTYKINGKNVLFQKRWHSYIENRDNLTN